MKQIITHINPDLDAIASAWLLKRFLLGWEEAEIGFEAADNSTLANPGSDDDPDILRVDIGRGKLDHHQTGKYLSATQLCWEMVKKERKGELFGRDEQPALERLVAVVTAIDNARDLGWPEVADDRHDFYLHNLIAGFKGVAKSEDQVIEFGFRALEAVFNNLKNKVRAEQDLGKATEFKSHWGKALALESGNRQTIWLVQVRGFCLAVKKDPDTGAVRIYARFDSKVDLTKAYKKFLQLDPQSDWFLHSSKKVLLNESGTAGNRLRPTKLSLEQIINVLQ